MDWDDVHVMLEDESGRIRLVGARVTAAPLVTGVIIGALGVETPNGDFEVVDICYAEMPPPTYPKEDDSAAMEVEGRELHFMCECMLMTTRFQRKTLGLPLYQD